MVAKVNMDEFGLGGTGLYSGFGYTHHPISKKYAPGGSSSGSAISVANNSVVLVWLLIQVTLFVVQLV